MLLNGTNSFTQNEVMYNMDIDFYSIENNISPGDTSAVIDLTSGQDFVMINTIITVLNSQLPDATISIDTVQGGDICGDRDLEITYTVYNLNCTDALPSGTPIAFYGDTTLVGQSQTTDISLSQDNKPIPLHSPYPLKLEQISSSMYLLMTTELEEARCMKL